MSISKPDLLVWKHVSDWRVKLEGLVPREFAASLISKMRSSPPSEAYSDSFCWLEPYADIGTLDAVVASVAKHLKHFRCAGYHACRPVDPSAYISRGILTRNRTAHTKALWRLILADERLRLCRDRKRFRELTAEIIGGPSDGRVFLALDDELLVEDGGGHYLIWGSESWQSVICAIGGPQCRDVLTTIGIPTIFEVELPLAGLSGNERKGLARAFLQAWFYDLVNPLRTASWCDFSFILHRSISPGRIVGHRHPEEIPYPPGLGHGVYRNPYRQCSLCG